MFKHHLAYLLNLQANNDRARFHENKTHYDQLRKELLEITQIFIDFLDPLYPLEHLDPKKCLFRINRDVRFSKDKSPYKTNFGIEIAPGGRRSGLPGFYLHIQPGNHSFIGGGLYMPDKEITHAIRDGIDHEGKTFQNIREGIQQDDFHSFEDRALKTIPRGYNKDHPYAALLRQRDRTMSKLLSDKQLCNKKTLDLIKDKFQKLVAFNTRLLEIIEEKR